MLKGYIGIKSVKAEPCAAWKDFGEHKAGAAAQGMIVCGWVASQSGLLAGDQEIVG